MPGPTGAKRRGLALLSQPHPSPQGGERQAEIGEHVTGVGDTEEDRLVGKIVVPDRLSDRPVHAQQHAPEDGSDCPPPIPAQPDRSVSIRSPHPARTPSALHTPTTIPRAPPVR